MDFDIYIGVLFIILGSILLYLSSTEWFIEWWQKRGMTNRENIKRTERNGALGLIFLGILYILFRT